MNYLKTQEGFAMIETDDRHCCDGLCDQRHGYCPAEQAHTNVIDFQTRAGLRRQFAVPSERRVSLALPLWFGAVNWFNVVTGALIVLAVLGVLAGLVGMVVTSDVLPDMSAIQHALGLAK